MTSKFRHDVTRIIYAVIINLLIFVRMRRFYETRLWRNIQKRILNTVKDLERIILQK